MALVDVLALLRNNYSALLDPVAGDDVTAGYQVGSVWVNTATNEAFVCVDSSAGAAVWVTVTNPTPTPEELAYTFFTWILINHPDNPFSAAEVLAGLDTAIYPNVGSIPTPPALPSIPNFAIIDDGDPQLKLAYWDFSAGAGGTWVVTSSPYDFPFLQAGHIINQIPANGAGNIAWQFTMGSEVRILSPGRILDMTIKLGAGGVAQQHRWAIRRSTVTGPTAPALGTYTDFIQDGIMTYNAADVWQSVGGVAPIVVAPDEWYIAIFFVGGGGQNGNITTLRTAGELVEDYAFLNAGLFVSTPGGFPGPNPLPTPTSRQPTIFYGVASLEFAAP